MLFDSCRILFHVKIPLQDYISVKDKYAKYLPHSAGRYAAKRFRKVRLNSSLYCRSAFNDGYHMLDF